MKRTVIPGAADEDTSRTPIRRFDVTLRAFSRFIQEAHVLTDVRSWQAGGFAATIFEASDPCHLAWQVNQILGLEQLAVVAKTPASLSGR